MYGHVWVNTECLHYACKLSTFIAIRILLEHVIHILLSHVNIMVYKDVIAIVRNQ